MGRLLFIMRHGLAENGAGMEDHERSLAATGVTALLRAVPGLSSLGVSPSISLASPLLRTRQTAAILCERLAPSCRAFSEDALRPGASPERLLGLIEEHPPKPQVLVVGHMPDVSGFVQFFVQDGKARPSFPAGSIVCIEFEQRLAARQGLLRWQKTTEQLAAIAPT